MIKIFSLLFCIVFAVNVFAKTLPKEIDNNLLTVKSIELMREDLKDRFYNIDELLVKRVMVDGDEVAVGINNVWGAKGECLSYLIIAEARKCSSVTHCRLNSMVVDCSQRSATIAQLLSDYETR